MEMQDILRILHEGANTAPSCNSDALTESVVNNHKISHPVRMAMQHYSEVGTKTHINKESEFKKLYQKVETEHIQEQTNKKKLLNQYAQVIAERVVSKTYPKRQVKESSDPADTVTVDIPLLIRLLEYAREDAKTDMDLHTATERMIALSKQTKVLSMSQYDAIVGDQKSLPAPDNNSDEQHG